MGQRLDTPGSMSVAHAAAAAGGEPGRGWSRRKNAVGRLFLGKNVVGSAVSMRQRETAFGNTRARRPAMLLLKDKPCCLYFILEYSKIAKPDFMATTGAAVGARRRHTALRGAVLSARGSVRQRLEHQGEKSGNAAAEGQAVLLVLHFGVLKDCKPRLHGNDGARQHAPLQVCSAKSFTFRASEA